MIISIAQQASPKPSGKIAFLRAQFCAVSNLREQQPLLDELLEVLAGQLAAQHLLGLEAAYPHVFYARASYFHSSAPLRQTNTNATMSSAMNTIVSTRANVPSTSSWSATG